MAISAIALAVVVGTGGTTPPEATVTFDHEAPHLAVAPAGHGWNVATTSGFDNDVTTGLEDSSLFRDFHIFYEVDGRPLSNWTAPVNVLNENKDPNDGIGPMLRRVFPAGSFTISGEMWELSSGKRAEFTLSTGSIQAPDSFFSNSEIIYVHPTGAGSPPSGAALATTLTDAMNQAESAGAQRWVQPASGETFQITDYNTGGTWANIYVAPPSGGRATIDPNNDNQDPAFRITNMNASLASLDVVFDRLDFLGGWDSTQESGTRAVGLRWLSGSPDLTVVSDCTFDGLEMGIWPGDATASGTRILANNTVITNWRDYGCFAGSSFEISYMGVRVSQHVDARSGGDKPSGSTPPFYNNHGPNRAADVKRLYRDGCDFFSRNGWFSNVGRRTVQPGDRVNSGSVNGSIYQCTRTTMEAGWSVLQMRNAQTSQFGLVCNMQALVERNLFVGTYCSATIIECQYGGVEIRNNILIHPNAETTGTAYQPLSFFRFECTGLSTGNELSPTRFRFNSCINRMAVTNADADPDMPKMITIFDSGAAHSGLVEEYNLIYQDAIATPEVSDGPVDSTVLFAPRYKGYQEGSSALLTATASPADTISKYAPASGAGALSAASGVLPRTDFDNTLRSAPTARGAFQGVST